MKRKFQIPAIVGLILMLVLTGCGKRSNQNSAVYQDRYVEDIYDYDYDYEFAAGEAEEMEYALADTAAAPAYGKSASAENGGSEGTQQRMIRKSAAINIQVLDPVSVMDAIIAMTEQMGGFVISSTSSQEYYSSGVYLPKADITIRVPAERLLEMLGFIEEQTGDSDKYVSNKRIYGVDITADYVDMTSRLTSLERTRDKLYEILDTAEDASQALEIYNSIADIESEIEICKGQIKYMEESVALSSIEIHISSIKPAPIQTVRGWSLGDVIKDAFETLLDAFKGVLSFLVYFLIVAVPILALIALPVILIIFFVKRSNKSRKKAGKAGNEPEPKKEDILTRVKPE